MIRLMMDELGVIKRTSLAALRQKMRSYLTDDDCTDTNQST